MNISEGVELIRKERERQVSEEGWTSEHDALWNNQQLSKAAMEYIYETDVLLTHGKITPNPSMFWPWDDMWWKPSDDPIRNLTKAGALIAAEIDRLLSLKENK